MTKVSSKSGETSPLKKQLTLRETGKNRLSINKQSVPTKVKTFTKIMK